MMKEIRLPFLALLFSFLVSACSPVKLQWNSDTPKEISGKLIRPTSSLNSSSATCSAKLYKLSDNGEREETALAESPIDEAGSFSFSLKNLEISFKKNVPAEPLIVIAEGCAQSFSRPITGAKEQNISAGSTLLSYFLNTPEKARLTEVLINNQSKVEHLINSLQESASVEEAYGALNGNSDIQSSFMEVLAVSPNILLQAAPQVLSLQIPSSGQELQSLTLAVSSTHWSPQYPIAYLWKLGNTNLSQNASLNFTPHENQQGLQTVTLYVGYDKGAGVLDTSKPYKTFSQNIQILNSVPPSPPGLSLVTSTPTNTSDIVVSINTGTGFENCRSFSKMALTVNESAAPLDLTRYNITCTQEGAQTHSITLPSGDGAKVLRLWAMDASNNISASATSTSIVLEQNPPVVTIQNMATFIKGGSTTDIHFTAQDLGSGITQAILEYSQDGANYSAITTISSPTQISQQYSWSVPLANVSTGRVRLRAQDGAGNWNTATTNSFTIDSTTPSLSLTSLNSGSYRGGSVQSITWTASDLHFSSTPIKIEYSSDNGSSWTSLENATANSGSYLWSLPLINSSSMRVRLSATDLAGNTSLASSSSAFSVDSQAPTLPTLSLLSSLISNNPTVNLNLSTCNDISKILINESLIAPLSTDPSWQTCSLTPSYIVAGEGLHTLQVWVQDAVGNINASSLSRSMTLDNTTPMLSLTSLNSGSFRGGEIQNINWTASDLHLSVSPIKLEYSSDNGATWSVILSSTANSGSHSWTLPALNSSQVRIRVTASDDAGNSSSAISSSALSVDSTAPAALTLTRTSSELSNSTQVNLSIAGCAGDAVKMLIKESATVPDAAAAEWETCGSSKSFTVSSGDGSKSVYAWARDNVGNISASSNITMTLDTQAPSLSLTSFNAGAYAGNTSHVISWNAADANFGSGPITLRYSEDNGSTWSNLATAVSNSANGCSVPSGSTGCYPWTPNLNSTQVRIQVQASDLLGQSTSSTSTSPILIDSSAPQMMSLQLNNSNTLTNSNTFPIALSASDNLSKITHFCLKYTKGITAPSAPSLTDGCWVAVNAPSPGVSPNTSINFSNHFYTIGLSNGAYKVFAWVKTETNLISSISNSDSGTSEVDMDDIEYTPGTPPVVVNLIGVSSDSHSTPPTSAETIVAAGQPLIIKWKATDDAALPANNIKLFYTTNEVDYTLIADNLSNSAGAGCSVDGTNYTGCYVATSPSSSFFKIRISVQDASATISLASAVPNNLNNFRILAGNTETGIGGSANSAVFNIIASGNTVGLPGTLVVADDGTIFVRDAINGIVKISPSSGLVETFIPRSGAITNGPIGTATLKNTSPIMTLGYDNSLLILDFDQIRKVNLSTNTVTTLVGGGATRTSGTAAAAFQILSSTYCYMCNLVALPNGDIYFSEGSATTKTIWRYQASDQKVYAINMAGTGITSRPVDDDVSSGLYKFMTFSLSYNPTTSAVEKIIAQFMPTTCPGCGNVGYPAFIDPATGNTITSPTPSISVSSNYRPAITARNGKIYQMSVEGSKRLVSYDSASNTWATILGTGTAGYCADNTDATACNVTIMDAFVTADSRIFFADNGLIRTIDSNNKVQTVFGQRLSFGDGGFATSARIQLASFFDMTSTGDIVFLDGLQNVIRRFTPGGLIELVAGNGNATNPTNDSLAVTSPIAGSWWGGRMQIHVNQATDDIYFSQTNNTIMQIRNSDRRIYRVIGGGGTSYSVGDGVAGSLIAFGNETSQLLTVANGKVLVASSLRNASAQNHKCYLKEYDINNNFTQIHVAGNDNLCTNTYPADGTSTATADVGNMSGNMLVTTQWLSSIGAWMIPRNGSNTVKLYTPGGTISTLKSGLPRSVVSATLVTNANSQQILYYCATNGRVYKYNIATSTETALDWPSSSYSCNGFTIKYSSTRGSVIFPFSQNGLTAIAEILDTP